MERPVIADAVSNLEALRSENARLHHELLQVREEFKSVTLQNQMILDAVDSVIIDWDLVYNRFTRINIPEGILGYRQDEIGNGIDWMRQVIHPDDMEKFNRAVMELLQSTQTELSIEVRCRHKDGFYCDLRGQAVVYRELGTSRPLRIIASYRDVTVERNIYRALQQNEKRYRVTIEAFDGVTFEWDLETGHFSRSANITRVLGYELHEVKPTLEWGQALYHPDESLRIRNEYQQVLLSEEKHYRSLMRMRHKSGEYRWMKMNCIIDRNEQGKARKVTGSYLDVTDQINAEQELRLSEERYRIATEAIQGIVFDWNVQTNVVYRSTGVYRILGYAAEEVVPHTDWWQQLIHDDDRQRTVQEAHRFIQSREMHGNITYRIRHRDGHYLNVHSNFLAIRNEHGQAERIVGCIIDLTPRIQAEQAQRTAEQNFHQLFQDVPLGLVVIDPDHYLVECNQAFADMVGVSVTQLIGSHVCSTDSLKAWSRLLHPDGASKDHELHFMGEQIITRTDGTPLPVYLRSKLIEYQNHDKPHYFVIAEDLTARKQSEQEMQELQRHMQETQKMESLGVLAGGIAHDFNNLLTVIMGNMSLLKQDTARHEKYQDAIEQSEQASMQAAELCKQLLAYAGRGKLENRPFNLSELVENSRALLNSAASRSHRLHFHLSSGLPCIAGDPSQIRQTLLNLVQNAAESMTSHGGTIDVLTGIRKLDETALQQCLFVQQQKPGDYVWLEVRDKGAGMDEAVRQRIFEPFYTTKFTGRGLGLSAVAGIVRNHRGFLQFNSTPNQGTSFRIYFPMDTSAASSLAIASTTPLIQATRKQGTILVVDDEPSVRMVLARLLARRGFAVIEAEDGEEALELLERHADALRLVILDLTMPRRDGMSALQEMRKAGNKTPVLVISGYYSRELAPKLDELQAQFLSKPFTQQSLLAMIDPILIDTSA